MKTKQTDHFTNRDINILTQTDRHTDGQTDGMKNSTYRINENFVKQTI